MFSPKVGKYFRKTVHILTLLLFFVIIMMPFYFIIITSFKVEKSILGLPIVYLPSPFTFANYAGAWRESNFGRYFWNTLSIAVMTLAIVTVASMMTGYSLSRYKFKGKYTVMILFLITQMVPGVLLIIPLFLIVQSLGLVNTLFSVALGTSATLLAYCSVLMRGFFSQISIQIEQAAWIDGCNKIQAVLYVVMPLILPGLVATGAYAFVNAWNSFLLPLILLTDPNKFTLTVGLRSLIGQYTISYGRLSAAGIICLIPAIAMFAYIQRQMVVGLTAGSIKG